MRIEPWSQVWRTQHTSSRDPAQKNIFYVRFNNSTEICKDPLRFFNFVCLNKIAMEFIQDQCLNSVLRLKHDWFFLE